MDQILLEEDVSLEDDVLFEADAVFDRTAGAMPPKEDLR
jgi:hypothetical protein